MHLQKLTSNRHDKTVTCGTVVQADLLRFASLLSVITAVADMIVVIMSNFIIPTKQMQLFTAYSASQLMSSCHFVRREQRQVYSLPRHISDTRFLQVEETLLSFLFFLLWTEAYKKRSSLYSPVTKDFKEDSECKEQELKNIQLS